jgi:hypothetical protein
LTLSKRPASVLDNIEAVRVTPRLDTEDPLPRSDQAIQPF